MGVVLARSEYLILVIPTEAGFNCHKRQREYEPLWQPGGWCRVMVQASEFCDPYQIECA